MGFFFFWRGRVWSKWACSQFTHCSCSQEKERHLGRKTDTQQFTRRAYSGGKSAWCGSLAKSGHMIYSSGWAFRKWWKRQSGFLLPWSLCRWNSSHWTPAVWEVGIPSLCSVNEGVTPRQGFILPRAGVNLPILGSDGSSARSLFFGYSKSLGK